MPFKQIKIPHLIIAAKAKYIFGICLFSFYYTKRINPIWQQEKWDSTSLVLGTP